MPAPADRPPVGLRERKKAKTRAAIQANALQLFREHGYDATTVQQIIEQAEVSQSTFFRYFPTKADVVLLDEFDPLIVAAFLSQPPDRTPIGALRLAFRTVFDQLSAQQMVVERDRLQLIFAVPELRTAMLDQFATTMRFLADALAQRSGREPADMAVLTVAGAVIGAAFAVMFAMDDDPTADFAALLDEAMAHLEAGLQL